MKFFVLPLAREARSECGHEVTTKTYGRSSWQSLQGKEFKSSVAVIGEAIDYTLVSSVQVKLQARWSSDIFTGNGRQG